jgi:hypothetical protein
MHVGEDVDGGARELEAGAEVGSAGGGGTLGGVEAGQGAEG